MTALALPDRKRRAAPRFRLRIRLVSVMAWAVYLFLMLPSLIVVPISFGNPREMVFPPNTLSIELYRRFFGAADWLGPIFMSMRVALGATAIALAVGVPAAYALVRGRFAGRRLAATLLFSPILVPVVVLALGLYFYFSRLGILGSEWSLIVSHAVFVLPFVLITCMAGLRHIDPNLEVAATIMGASELRTFLSVTLPLLRPAMLAGALFAFLMSFDEIVIAYFISKPTAMTLPVKMFSSIQWEISPIIAVVSTVLTLFSLVVCLVGAPQLERRTK